MKVTLELLQVLGKMMGDNYLRLVMFSDGSGHIEGCIGNEIKHSDFVSLSDLDNVIIFLMRQEVV